MTTANTLSPVRASLPIQPEYRLASGPTFDGLMHRYAEQERKYLNDSNYVPTVAEFRDLQMLGDDIKSRPRLQSGWEERPEAEMTFVGPHGKVDQELAVKIKRLADPATWLRDHGDERLFVEAAGALEGRVGTPHRTEKEELELFDAAETAAVGSIFDTGSLTPEKFDRLAELSRVSRRQLERQGVDVDMILRRRGAAKVTGRAAVPGHGRGDDFEAESMSVEGGHPQGRAKARTQEKRLNFGDEPDEDTLLRLMQEGRVASTLSVASMLYPEKMAGGSTVYPWTRGIAKDLARRGLRRALGRDPVELDRLTQDERARVHKLSQQLAGVKRLEGQDTEQYRAGLDRVPAWYEIRAEIFPDSKGRDLTEAETNVLETVRARLERHHEGQAKPDRFMRLRLAMDDARKRGSALVADAKKFVTDAQEFAVQNARTVRVAGAAALALTVALAISPDAQAPTQDGPKAVGSSTSQPYARRSERNGQRSMEQKPDDLMPTAGRKPTGSYPRHEAIEVEYR